MDFLFFLGSICANAECDLGPIGRRGRFLLGKDGLEILPASMSSFVASMVSTKLMGLIRCFLAPPPSKAGGSVWPVAARPWSFASIIRWKVVSCEFNLCPVLTSC